MNESASKSSLASSGGKPSTANSTGSPNGRKTRTIIVARAIPAEPATVVSAAIRGEVASNAVVSQHHTRDARSGKLASYAALGAEEDVERFDRFLAEQRGHPSASELRAAATSPQHMMASMKRKTMSRIQLDGIDGKTSSAEATGEDAAARKLMQKELENDARKRREEAVAHRKWLNSLPIHERVAQQRQQNVLRKWRQMNRDWETFKNRAARRLGKAPQELVMSRAAVYREQREMYDALQKARPLSDKVGGDIWLVSLRNEGTRFVPVGNIFSGLFCPIRESTKLGPRVRRPLDYHDNQREREHEASRPLSKLEKRSLDLLARKKWRLHVAKFYEVNEAAEFNDVYFSPALMRTCYDLFERAQGILGDLLSDQEPVDQEESLTKESGEGHEGVDGTEKTNDAPSLVSPEQSNDLSLGVEDDVEPETTKRVSLPALVVQGWNWRLETLRELCKKADEAQNTQIGRLTQQLKKVIEEVEEDDENEEADEDENEEVDDTEDGEEDEGGDGSETGEIDAAKAKPISPREVRKNERLARRTALEDEIQSLVPNLQEAFDTMLFSSYTTPYSSMRLQERLYERIGSLCGETPVVCEIAKATNAASSAQAATLEGVGKLLMCAIDEAVGGDQDHQALVEQRRRRIQNMWLSDKASYLSVGQLMIKPPISIAEPPSEVLTADSVHNPAAPKSPESIDNSGVLLMQVDLDLAPWFSLVKVENRGSASQADETPPKIEFAWHISQELVQHPNYVPAKVVQATESLVKVLDALPSTNPLVHTVVLVSELSRPPLTKPMHKLLRNVAQAELKAKATATSQIGGETEEIKDRGSAEGEEAEVEIMKTLLQRLTSQLSLRGIAQVMQRAIQKDVVFCSAVEEVQGQIDFGRKELLLNSSLSLGGIESEAVGNEVEVDSEQQETAISPRILLLEHLGAAGIDLIAQVARQQEEQADEVDDEEDRGKKTRKRRASELASARLKPLVEPSGADFFDRKRQGTYEGERAHVVLNPSSESGWRTFREVSAQCLPSARVTEGKASVLHSLWPESEADDAEDESDDMAGHKTPMARFEYEWTFRALDVGPIAMEGLTKALKPETPCVGLDDPTANGDTSVVSRALIVNGVCGAIEFYEFCAATKQLLGILQLYSPCDVFIAGYSTASRIHQLEIEQLYNAHAMNDKISGTSATANGNAGSSAAPRKVVDDRTKRNARVLKQLLAAKRHPVLANLASSESE
ncbi:hypothetical protein PF003_g10306 [Phytophthora fragariae]|nr:hypothetical protein PF003_g10306 [Phytophthora fragariae]